MDEKTNESLRARIDRPEKIWLLHEEGDCGSDVWCDDPNPGNEPSESTAYIRLDKYQALEAKLAVAREALEYAMCYLPDGCIAAEDDLNKALEAIDLERE